MTVFLIIGSIGLLILTVSLVVGELFDSVFEALDFGFPEGVGSGPVTIAAAEAAAEQSRLTGEGERARRTALAEALQREGEAEGAAILARGTAEATAREKNAEAFQGYNEAAVLELVVQALPDVVNAASEPMSNIDRMTVISTDGASQLSKTVASNLEQGLQMGSDLTGVDLRTLITNLVQEHKSEGGGGVGTLTKTRTTPATASDDNGDNQPDNPSPS